MVYFLAGIIVGGAGILIILGYITNAATNFVKQTNHDEADWWKNGEENPYEE